MGIWYWLGLAAGAGLFARHSWLIRSRDRAACFRVFLDNHYVGMAVFVGILLNYTFR
jgi:4-hydroxybenzoate polyprenyltransferase